MSYLLADLRSNELYQSQSVAEYNYWYHYDHVHRLTDMYLVCDFRPSVLTLDIFYICTNDSLRYAIG